MLLLLFIIFPHYPTPHAHTCPLIFNVRFRIACDAGRYQQITFAESFNLINWTRPSPLNTSFFDIDTRFYKNPGRWDCIYSTPQDPSGPDGPRDGCVVCE